MTGAQAVVEQFLCRWDGGIDEFCVAVSELFTAATVWENVGYSTTVGADEAIEHLRESSRRLGWVRVEGETLAIATTGGHVLTERLDHHRAPNGTVVLTVRVASVFDVLDGKITAIREYFDLAPLLARHAAAAAET